MSQITTHILDTARGCPAEGVHVYLYEQDGEGWNKIAQGITDSDGRTTQLLNSGEILDAGTYRVHFEVSGYFRNRGAKQFYPWVDVVFCIDGDGQHYHIPLLLSTYGYTTYRGS